MSKAFLLRRLNWLRNSMRLRRCKNIGIALELFCRDMRSILTSCLFCIERLEHLQEATIGIFIGRIAWALLNRTDGDRWRVVARTRKTRKLVDSKSDLGDAVLLENLDGLAGLGRETGNLTYELPYGQDGVAELGDLEAGCRASWTTIKVRQKRLERRVDHSGR